MNPTHKYIIMQRLINQIVERAKANRQRIVLPEGTEERTLKAANQALTDETADLILLGNPDEINECAKKWGLGNIGKAIGQVSFVRYHQGRLIGPGTQIA